jgi:hypothetical protein
MYFGKYMLLCKQTSSCKCNKTEIAHEIILFTDLARDEYNDPRHAQLRILVYKRKKCLVLDKKKIPYLFGISQQAITTKIPRLYL